jgi:predicted YcjX-like family ATPase
MYEVSRKGRIHNVSIKCQLDLGVDTFRRNKSLQNLNGPSR